MKINRLPLLMIAAAVICALLGGCAGARAQTRDSVSVWYIEGDALAGPLAQAASEYNGAVEDGLLGVSLRSFSDEAALSAAFESGRPDLLLCSTAKAVDLYERGVLRDVGAAFVPMALGLIPLFLLRWRINLLTLGEEEAQTLGVPVLDEQAFLKKVNP